MPLLTMQPRNVQKSDARAKDTSVSPITVTYCCAGAFVFVLALLSLALVLGLVLVLVFAPAVLGAVFTLLVLGLGAVLGPAILAFVLLFVSGAAVVEVSTVVPASVPAVR